MQQVGDRVKVIIKDSFEEGVLMPSSKEDIVIIKLDNGYNIGFEKKKIDKIEVISKKKKIIKKVNKKISIDKNLKTVSILHCGGTIASKVDYDTGAVKAKFTPEELLEMFPELGKVANIRSKLVANMLSENMRFIHYNIIAEEIEKEIKAGTDGVIITHGTDMLHYTASALSFILDGLNVPVLLVGAQRSSDRGSSDAFLNLQCAVQFIVKCNFVEVAICMHNSVDDDFCAIIPGVRSRKIHSSRRDAFKSINSEIFALVDSEGGISWQRNDYVKKEKKRKLSLKYFNDKLKIGLLKAHPQMFAEELSIYENFSGLVLEGTGLGHFPIESYDENSKLNEKVFSSLQKLANKMPIVMTTQTIYGTVNLDVYSPGRKLQDVGVFSGGDMITETAFIKLAWLLSNYKQDKIKDLFTQNLRGEVSSQRIYQKEFI